MGIDVNAKTGGFPALFYCSRDYKMLELLISYGADVNHVSGDGITALMTAFETSKPIPVGAQGCVRLLLESGANVHAVCNFGWNALVYALVYKYPNVSDVKLLLEYNIDMEGLYKSLKGDVSKPLLYTAYNHGNFEVAELLLESGIDMTKQDWLLDTEHLPNGLRGNSSLYNKLVELYRNPQDLRFLVRNNLRRLFGRYIRTASTQFGLPKALENFVAY